ncbi:unnamed protein product [Vicia faba]|uniref:Citrulline--aspartate ligase n=1 Tax=Vicia faba TaxID=3906 RepID=A0AAV0YJS2_VICFA|nr:unnamed protein product [Vicia faba]
MRESICLEPQQPALSLQRHVLLLSLVLRQLSMLNLVAPWRDWDITGREYAIEFAKKHNVPVPVTKKSIYSRDRNLWHVTIWMIRPMNLKRTCTC